jgi:hypothetical protein
MIAEPDEFANWFRQISGRNYEEWEDAGRAYEREWEEMPNAYSGRTTVAREVIEVVVGNLVTWSSYCTVVSGGWDLTTAAAGQPWVHTGAGAVSRTP